MIDGSVNGSHTCKNHWGYAYCITALMLSCSVLNYKGNRLSYDTLDNERWRQRGMTPTKSSLYAKKDPKETR
jgi:hypothetical protein